MTQETLAVAPSSPKQTAMVKAKPTSTQAYMETALAAQRSFMDQYGDPLEQMLSVMVYLVPVQENDESDVAGFWSQSVYSVIDLFGLYRTVLLRSPEALPVVAPEGADSNGGACSALSAIVFGRSGGAQSRNFGAQLAVRKGAESGLQHARLTYTVAAFALRAIRGIQVLIEMHAHRAGGAKHALKVCFRVEVIKLILKLVLRSRMPFAFYIDEEALEEVEPPKVAKKSPFGGPTPPPQKPPSEPPATPGAEQVFVGRRSGRTLPSMPPPGAPARLNVADTTAASMRIALGEALFHARPLLHLWALMRRGRKSWVAWVVPLVLDQLSMNLIAPVLSPRMGTRAGSLEVAEMRRRKNLLWWALIRSPFFDKFLRRPCEILDKVMSKIPLINIFRIMELFLALQPFHFTTSAS